VTENVAACAKPELRQATTERAHQRSTVFMIEHDNNTRSGNGRHSRGLRVHMTSLYVTPRLSAVNVSARVSRIWIGATMLDGYPLALLMGRFAEGDSRGAQ
jgi:hypothetical protein